MTFADLVNLDLVASVEATEARNFKTALTLCKEAINNLAHCEAHERDDLKLKIDRQIDYIERMMAAKNPLEEYYAGSAGASVLGDIKAGRHKTIEV